MDSPEQVISEISQKIQNLANLSKEDLKGEMQELKKALLENPAACALMLPEDIGLMVTHLRTIVGTAIAVASSKPTRKSPAKETSKRLTPEELAAALDSEDF